MTIHRLLGVSGSFLGEPLGGTTIGLVVAGLTFYHTAYGFPGERQFPASGEWGCANEVVPPCVSAASLKKVNLPLFP